MVARSNELVADTAYGSAELLNWLAYDQGIEPHIRVFDRPEPLRLTGDLEPSGLPVCYNRNLSSVIGRSRTRFPVAW